MNVNTSNSNGWSYKGAAKESPPSPQADLMPTKENPAVPSSSSPRPKRFSDGLAELKGTTAGRKAFNERKALYLSSKIKHCTVPTFADVYEEQNSSALRAARTVRTYYVVRVTNGDDLSWIVTRTYTDFEHLYEALKSNPVVAAFSFPSKGIGAPSAAIKGQRREAFASFINMLMSEYHSGAKRRLELPRELAEFLLPTRMHAVAAPLQGRPAASPPRGGSVRDRWAPAPHRPRGGWHEEVPAAGSALAETGSLATALFSGGRRTFYNLEVENDAGVAWAVSKTYTEFKAFYRLMAARYPLELADYRFPGKAYLLSSSREVKRERHEKFAELATRCINISPQTPELWNFFSAENLVTISADAAATTNGSKLPL